MCETCHDAIPEFTRRVVEEVKFPSGAALTTGNFGSNLCINCHQGRESTVSVNEGLAGEIETLADILYGAILDYAANVVGSPIVYDGHAYPYFFNDSNANGQVDEGEASYGNRFQSWTPRLLRTAYNYQYAQKAPGAFAHNGQYMIQVNFCKMEIMLTVGRKNLLRDFSSRGRTCFSYRDTSPFFKEITPTISLKNISLISILQNS